MNHGLRLETLKRLDEEGCKYVHRAEREVDGQVQCAYAVTHLDDRYVLFCKHTGVIFEHGDEENVYSANDGEEDTQWALDFLFNRAQK